MNLPTLPTQGPSRVAASTFGSFAALDLAELCQAVRRQRGARDIVDHRR